MRITQLLPHDLLRQMFSMNPELAALARPASWPQAPESLQSLLPLQWDYKYVLLWPLFLCGLKGSNSSLHA